MLNSLSRFLLPLLRVFADLTVELLKGRLHTLPDPGILFRLKSPLDGEWIRALGEFRGPTILKAAPEREDAVVSRRQLARNAS